MAEYERNLWWYKFNGLSRYLLAHLVSKIVPLYIVNEYPKSGGSWVAQMLSDALGVPFPRNRLPMLRSSILHEHMMHDWNMHNIVIVWRDGRDIAVSFYYHSLFYNDKGNRLLVDKCRSDLKFDDYNDIKQNMPRFIEYLFEDKKHPRMTWVEFVDKWFNHGRCVYVKYEELLADTAPAFGKLVSELTGSPMPSSSIDEIVRKYSFENISGRKKGHEKKNSFLRKGIAGDWKNHFSFEAREIFNHYAGDSLIKLNYESDSAWVAGKHQSGG
jgi:hypothetical protein